MFMKCLSVIKCNCTYSNVQQTLHCNVEDKLWQDVASLYIWGSFSLLSILCLSVLPISLNLLSLSPFFVFWILSYFLSFSLTMFLFSPFLSLSFFILYLSIFFSSSPFHYSFFLSPCLPLFLSLSPILFIPLNRVADQTLFVQFLPPTVPNGKRSRKVWMKIM